jgi:hypothetical protein
MSTRRGVRRRLRKELLLLLEATMGRGRQLRVSSFPPGQIVYSYMVLMS